MSQKSLNKSLRLFIAFAMMQSPFLPSVANAADQPPPIGAGSCSVRKACDKKYNEAQALVSLNVASEDVSDGTSSGGDQLSSSATSKMEVIGPAITACQKKCVPDQNGCKKADCKKMEDNLASLESSNNNLADVKNDASTTGDESRAAPDSAPQSSGGGSSLMPALLGAAAGGLLGYMLGKKAGEKEKDKDKEDDDSAILENGQLDCSKDNAYKFQGCNGVLETVCMTAMSDPRCVTFAGRYCAAQTNGGNQVAVFPSQGGGDVTTKGVPGEGIGSPFCKKSMAVNYCKAAGRDQCPSCVNLQKMALPACQQTPALCIAQNSPQQVEAAKQVCPTDPAFSDPTFLAGGNPLPGGGAAAPPVIALPGDPTIGVPNPNAPAPVAGGGAGAGAGAGAGNAPPVVAVQSVGAQDAGMREAQANGTVSNGGSGGGSSGGSNFQPASTGGASRELASAGSGGAFRSGSTGPASDVQGKFGPSLFAVGTQIIRNRCAAGKFNNCP